MILTHGANSLSRVLVLTYFKTTPIGDRLLQFSYNSYFEETTMTIGANSCYGALAHNMTENTNAGSDINISNYNKVSLDYFIQPLNIQNDAFVQIYGVTRFIRFYKAEGEVKIQVDENPGQELTTLAACNDGDIVHLGFVYDRVNQKERIYVNGVFAKEINTSGSVARARIRCLARSAEGSFKVTAWRLNTKDISNGNTYPIPSVPNHSA